MALETERPLALTMTEDEFATWCDEDIRAEFVNGSVVLMGTVSLLHADVNGFLRAVLRGYLELHPHGRALSPEVAVRLRAGLRRVPDLLYLAAANRSKLRPNHIEGAPDVVWEIISPDSEERDWRDKLPEYEAAGVPEYWIVNPYIPTVHLYHLEANGKYQRVNEQDGRLASVVIPGFWIRPEWLWQEPLPRVMDCLRELEATP